MATETLEEKAARLEVENVALKKQLDDLQQESTSEITRISAELSKAKKIADEAEPTITVEKVDYMVLGKVFTWKHIEYTVADLLKNKGLQTELVKAGAGFLVKK